MKFKDKSDEFDYCHRALDRISHKGIRKTWVNIAKNVKYPRVLYINKLCEQVIRELGVGIILGQNDDRILHKYKEKAFLTMSIMRCILIDVPSARSDYDKAVDWEFGTAKSKRKEFKENVWDQVSNALHNEEFWSDKEINESPKEILINDNMKKEFVELFENMPNAETSKELMERFWKFFRDTSRFTKHNYSRDEIFWYI